MQYRNKVTGHVIEVKSPVSGKTWEPVTAPSLPKEEKAVKKNGRSRK